MSTLRPVMRDLRQLLGLLRQSSLALSIIGGVLTLLEVVLGIGVLYAIKLLIDTLSAGGFLDGSQAEKARIFLYLTLVCVALLMAVLAQSAGNLVRTAQGMRIGEYVDKAIHERAIEVDLGFYESPQYFDSLHRARAAGTQRPAQMVNSLLLMGKSSLFLLAVVVMIAGIDWRILPFLLLAIAAILAVRLRFTRRLFEWQRSRIQKERRASYLDWLITSDQHAKEVRIGGLGVFLRDAYGELRQQINSEHLGIEKQKTVAEFLASTVGALVFAGATTFLVFEAMNGQRSVGDLVLFVLLFRRAEGSGRELVANASRLYDDRLFLSQIFEFLAIQPQIRAPAEPMPVPVSLTEGVRLEGVDFSYPGSSDAALSDINLSIRPGQVVALVGENGSGKTSLVKLLARLYDPQKGRITLEGMDIRAFDPTEYRQLFSAVFQDYARYAATVRQNVRFGDINAELQEGRIERVGKLAGIDGFVSRLADGYDTPLTRMFDDGQEISVGQWQRIALARAFYPASQFIIMDEPSSALDPQAEYELFENFRDRIEGRGALIVSHRLSTVRMADYTYVLDRGRVAEHGTHDDLVKQDGQYAALFFKQGRHFQ